MPLANIDHTSIRTLKLEESREFYESVLGMKVAFLNSGLIKDMMVHEVFDYNKVFGKAADSAKGITKPGN